MSDIEKRPAEKIDVILQDKFLSLISVCNEEHLLYCKCQDDKINKEFNKLLVVEEQELKKLDLADSPNTVKHRKKQLLHKAHQIVAEQCIVNNVKCPQESREVFQTTYLFAKKFDLDDPRVYMIVKSVLSHQLSVYRMQLQSNHKGILQTVVDEEGNTTYTLNPVEDSKMRFDNSIISAIEKLDKIISGEKRVNVNVEIRDIEDLYKDETLQDDDVIDIVQEE